MRSGTGRAGQVAASAVLIVLAACGDGGGTTDGAIAMDASSPRDADPSMDAGPDAPAPGDAGTDGPSDSGVDAGTDGGGPMDAGAPDASCPDRPAQLVIAPTFREFGGGGGTSSAERFTVSNIGGSPTGVVSHSFDGPDGDVFSVVTSTCMGVTLAPCTTCIIDVRFEAGPPGPGEATLTASADPGGMAVAMLRVLP